MVKTVTLLKRRSDLSHGQFDNYWRDVHGPLVLKLPGVRGYVQSRPIRLADAEPEYDGVAEVWYDDLEAMNAALASEAYETLLDDEKNFLGASTGESIFLTLSEDRLL